MTTMSILEQVKLDITEMSKIGAYRKAKAQKMAAYVDSHKDEVEDYRGGGMRISEIADLISQLV